MTLSGTTTHAIFYLKNRSWGDSSVVKSICCSFRCPGFDSLHPHGSAKPSVTPVPRDAILLISVGTRHTSDGHTYMQTTLIHKIENKHQNKTANLHS